MIAPHPAFSESNVGQAVNPLLAVNLGRFALDTENLSFAGSECKEGPVQGSIIGFRKGDIVVAALGRDR